MLVSGTGRRGHGRPSRSFSILLLALTLASLLGLSSCRRENPSTFDRNLPPETFISLAPAESTLAYYQVRLFWNGMDPDGLVDRFEFAVTDSNKTPGEDTPEFSGFFSTVRTDSLFLLSADDPQILGHRFYVRAVDNEGKADPTPAWTYFIAHNYNFPNVVFTRGIGTWTDKFGDEHQVEITSNNRFDPTDTIGVGGCVEYAWTGFDVDVGGSIVGFEFRRSDAVDFAGGTLADTSFSTCYDGLDTGRPYTGKDALHVRAIDDAGARTLPDSVRAVVINFDPKTWVLDPLRTDQPVRNVVFQTRDTDEIYPSGTTLADGFRGIRFFYTGFDDPRDPKPTPDDVGVTGYSFRRLRQGGGPAYREIEGEPFPAINVFEESEGQSLLSGTYEFLIRTRDELQRWGKPETVQVIVNYPPFFTSATYFDRNGVEQPLWTPGSTEEVVIDHPLNGGNPPPLQIRFQASDSHSVENPHPLEITPVVEDEDGSVEEYRARINGASDGFEVAPVEGPSERFLEVSTSSVDDNGRPVEGKVRPDGTNRLELVAKDNSGKTHTVVVPFRVNLVE